ncbi:MAG: hypothetical protein KDK70_29665, partial [Myxococcales bacterium]|nr:hypothetical protein [Myxococcales bacterium]
MTRSSFRTRLWLGFGLMGIAIVALGWVALSSTHRLARASDWIRAASAHQATARRVGVAARDWATLLERAAVGEPVTPQALDETQR